MQPVNNLNQTFDVRTLQRPNHLLYHIHNLENCPGRRRRSIRSGTPFLFISWVMFLALAVAQAALLIGPAPALRRSPRCANSIVMDLQPRARAQKELAELLDGVAGDVESGARDLGSARSMRARVRLRRSLRRVDESIGRISAAVEDELNELREQQKITRPSINSVRNQLAQAMSRNGSIDQLIPSGSQAASEAGSEAWLRPTAASDMRLPGRRFAIVTTAALPWMTGTSINPLLRAASLASKGYEVSLVLPWLLPAQQPTLFPAGVTFDEPAEQEVWIREWLRRGSVADAASLERLTVRWYPGVYEEFLGAVIQRSRVDLTSVVPAAERDVAILEEPEHINWYHSESWPHRPHAPPFRSAPASEPFAEPSSEDIDPLSSEPASRARRRHSQRASSGRAPLPTSSACCTRTICTMRSTRNARAAPATSRQWCASRS